MTVTDPAAKKWQEEMSAFWNTLTASPGIQPLSTAGDVNFREHPVWFGVVAGLLADAPEGRPLRVADMGTGTGVIAEILARLGCHVIGVDIADARVEQARERLAAFPNAEARVGDVTAPPIEAGEVDVVVSRNLVWLLQDPAATLATWGSLTGPGGLVAAIDGTNRTTRHRFGRLQQAVGLQKSRDGVLPGSPVTRERGTPLSDVADAESAAYWWSKAGLTDVTPIDLSWVTAARQNTWPLYRRLLRRDAYFAVTGKVPAAEA